MQWRGCLGHSDWMGQTELIKKDPCIYGVTAIHNLIIILVPHGFCWAKFRFRSKKQKITPVPKLAEHIICQKDGITASAKSFDVSYWLAMSLIGDRHIPRPMWRSIHNPKPKYLRKKQQHENNTTIFPSVWLILPANRQFFRPVLYSWLLRWAEAINKSLTKSTHRLDL